MRVVNKQSWSSCSRAKQRNGTPVLSNNGYEPRTVVKIRRIAYIPVPPCTLIASFEIGTAKLWGGKEAIVFIE